MFQTTNHWYMVDHWLPNYLKIVTWEISSHYEPINQIMKPNILNQSTIMITLW